MASLSEYVNLLGNHVLEARFIRRHPKINASTTRRAFITNSPLILNSVKGRMVLRFNGYGTGANGLGFSPANKNLVLAWDILWLDFRLFGAEGSEIITKIPVSNEKEATNFWAYFEKNIQPMTPDEKIKFMNA